MLQNSLDALIRRNAVLKITCRACRRVRMLPAQTLSERFRATEPIQAIAAKMICQTCRHHAAEISLAPPEITIRVPKSVEN